MTETPNRALDLVHLMLSAAGQVRIYTEGMTKENFLQDPKTQDAAIMKLLIIGELAAQLLDQHAELVVRYPSVPWHQMKGMRNRMAHGYFELDLDVVWDTVQTAVPKLEAELLTVR